VTAPFNNILNKCVVEFEEFDNCALMESPCIKGVREFGVQTVKSSVQFHLVLRNCKQNLLHYGCSIFPEWMLINLEIHRVVSDVCFFCMLFVALWFEFENACKCILNVEDAVRNFGNRCVLLFYKASIIMLNRLNG
jgi:hypothetical protein